MKRSSPIILLIGLWLLCFSLSILVPYSMAPTGDGFTRGLNRVGAFLLWQFAGLIVAVVAAVYAGLRLKESKPWRMAGFAPLICHVLMVVAISVTFMVIHKTQNAAAVSQALPQTTAPATMAVPVSVREETAVSPADATDAPESRTFQGIYRSGFEASHFYTMDGQGPWWLVADGPVWEKLQAYRVERTGRGSGITVAMTANGWLEDSGSDPAQPGTFEHRIHLVSIDAIRAVTPEEFDLILQTILAHRPQEPG